MADSRRWVLALASTLLVALSACGGDSDGATLHGTRVDPPFTVASEPLKDTDGNDYSLADSTETTRPLSPSACEYTTAAGRRNRSMPLVVATQTFPS